MQPDEFRYSPIQTLLEEEKVLSISWGQRIQDQQTVFRKQIGMLCVLPCKTNNLVSNNQSFAVITRERNQTQRK